MIHIFPPVIIHKFSLTDFITDESIEIGNTLLCIINVFSKNNWYEVVDAADSISRDMCTIVKMVEKYYFRLNRGNTISIE